MVDVVSCAVSKETPDQALAEIELIRKILYLRSLRWKVFCNSQANNRMYTD